MKVHILQHVAFEGPGSILDWLKKRAAAVSYSKLYEANTRLPNAGNYDLIIVMGGPMSVNDEKDYTWLAAEKHFIATAINADIAVLGICLGAQLIASACGSQVYQGSKKEIGWWPIEAAEPESGCFQFPGSTTVFHWHGETFDLPAEAHRLAGSDVCPNQAFQLGARVIGLQFHLETTEQSMAAIIEHCGDELVAGDKIQTAEQMRCSGISHYSAINALMGEILDYLTATS